MRTILCDSCSDDAVHIPEHWTAEFAVAVLNRPGLPLRCESCLELGELSVRDDGEAAMLGFRTGGGS